MLLALIILGLMYLPGRFFQTPDILDAKEREKAVSQAKKVVFPLELNTAGVEELQLLPGIGPVKAEAILSYRESKGGFASVEELLEVSGIGERTLGKIKEYVIVNPQNVQNSTGSKNRIVSEKQLLNVNLASQEELERLPGIGPVKAKAIVDFREKNGPFKSVEDLVQIPGIGEKTLEKLLPYITVFEGSNGH
ncbi:MAG: ComEA family DNA-binding protein [Thermotogae bacterium]|nr:ComEA family DNA-binding protein [Thermotogota bacterium]